MADGKTIKVWEPNETQRDFMKVLENYPDGATLKDIELDTGKSFKTGLSMFSLAKAKLSPQTENSKLTSFIVIPLSVPLRNLGKSTS